MLVSDENSSRLSRQMCVEATCQYFLNFVSFFIAKCGAAEFAPWTAFSSHSHKAFTLLLAHSLTHSVRSTFSQSIPTLNLHQHSHTFLFFSCSCQIYCLPVCPFWMSCLSFFFFSFGFCTRSGSVLHPKNVHPQKAISSSCNTQPTTVTLMDKISHTIFRCLL